MIGNEKLHKHGPGLWFLIDPYTANGVTTTFDWYNLGTIEERSEKIDTKSEVIMNDSSGVSLPVDEIENALDEQYEFTSPNTNDRMMAILCRSLPAVSFTQAATAVTGASTTGSPGQWVKIYDKSTPPVPQMMVGSIQSVTFSSTPLVRGVDYQYTQDTLDMGFFFIYWSSTVVTTPQSALTISYTPAAMTGNLLLTKLSGPQVIKGYGELWVTSGAGGPNKIQFADRWAITITDPSFSPEKRTRMKVSARRLYDPTASTPSRVLLAKGYPELS